MFKRRGGDAPEVLDAEPGVSADANGGEASGQASHGASGQAARPGYTPKKGAPTPKRSEAEASRRHQPYRPPADRKAAAQASRERNRADRIRKAEALQRGEDWALPAKDKGEVRALARDVVDARRGVSEYYLVIFIVLVVILFAGRSSALVTDAVDALVIVLAAIIVVEGMLVTAKVKRLVQQRLPGQSTKGLGVYVTMRAISMRRMRMPKPRVNPGDSI